MLCKDEGLNKLLGLAILIGGLANDLDDNIIKGSLRVDIGDTDFAVLEVKSLNTLLDSLLSDRMVSSRRGKAGRANGNPYMSSNRDVGHFSLATVNKLRSFAVKELQGMIQLVRMYQADDGKVGS